MLSTYGLQRAAPDVIRGRIFSFDYGLVTLVISASTILAGILSEQLAPGPAVWAMVGLIIVAGLGWAWFTAPLRSHDPARFEGSNEGYTSAPTEQRVERDARETGS